ncbi:phosphatidylglycerophosphatase A family protein [Desulfatibacillum aliphaticivorans]|uniref:phosphatidylglycerophosphatase A family protein n=1 Tax=Desulfatibacillum aliphaticivorans TaxID=218208 RepID=UPI0004873554|nr:phosphatidylglycerophosphatase A [Desulfatibacillum aliphaticivorans]
MDTGKKWPVTLATGFYVGLIPKGPGTFGTLWGIPLAWIMWQVWQWQWLAAAVLAAAFIAVSVPIADKAAKAMGAKDPGAIVIDEIAGYMVTLFAVPFSFKAAVAGFILFRIFDIFKPPPVSTLDENLSGGLGIVADDLAAGVYAHILLRIFLHYF